MPEKFEIPFINSCIRAFAKRSKMAVPLAFQYLDAYHGISFLIDHYTTLHLQSIDDTVDDLIAYCKRNGGTLA